MSSEFETDGLSGSNEALAAYLGRYEYTVVFERADGRLRKELDRPTIEGTSGHRSTHLFAEKRRSRGPRAHAKAPASFRKEPVRSSRVAGRGQRVRESLHSRAGRRRRREVSAAPGQTPRLDSSNEEGTSLAGRGDWRRVYPLSHPVHPAHDPKQPASSLGLRGCKVGGRAREPFRLQRCEEGSSTFLTAHFGGRTGTGHPTFIATRIGRRVSIADSWSAILARGATPDRFVGSDVVGASLHHRRRRSAVVFAWTRGPPSRVPGERTVSLVGDRARSTKASHGESQGVSSRVTSLAILRGWAGNPKPSVPPARVSTHQNPIGPPKLDRRESARKASRHEPGHGEEAARSGDVHRLPTLIANTITAMLPGQRCHRAQRARARVDRKEDHVSSGIRNGSPGARGTRRLLKSKRGILLAPGVSTKGEALNAKHGAVRRFVSGRRVTAR
jgi:hypothetical protein